MKNIVKLVFVIAFVALCSKVLTKTTQATIKLAHINKMELAMTMPEHDSAQVKLQKFVKELQEFLDELQVELNKKQDEYQKNQANWSELVRESKMQDLVTMSQKVQASQQQAEEKYNLEYQKIFQPVIEKADKAIETVAKEQGVTYVINGDPQVLLFKAVGTLDLLPLVKTHLGIKK